MPLVANNFVLFQIFGWTFILGIIALSLMFLGGLGGMVSLAQMTIAGLAGYMVGILGVSGTAQVSLGLAWWIAVPAAIVIATVFGTMVGALAVRTEGIYTIMITLAVAAAFFYFTRQNYTIFNGYSGLSLIIPRALRHRLAPAGCLLLPGARRGDALLWRCDLCDALTLWHRAPGRTR
jgi:branched-chain amino acid transport system permease protein